MARTPRPPMLQTMESRDPIVDLQLVELDIHRLWRSWRLYFVVATEDPCAPDRMLLAAFPEQTVRFTFSTRNHYRFVPAGAAAEGLVVLERAMPRDRTIRTRLWLRHSRRAARNAGEVLRGLVDALGRDLVTEVAGALGGIHPWLSVVSDAIGGVRGLSMLLESLPDRDLGMVSLDEVFGPEADEPARLLRRSTLSTGHASLCWAWSADGPRLAQPTGEVAS